MDADEFTVTHNEQVFNIRDFLKVHPGGKNYLEPYKNREIDEAMKHWKHASSAYHLLDQFKTKNDPNEEPQDNLDDLVDLDKPLMSQIGNLGERYNEWVMLPVNKRLKFFENKFLESLTFTPWYLVPLFWVPINIYMFVFGIKRYLAITQDPSPFLPIFFTIICGVIAWTLFEYAIHRWIFHLKPSGNYKSIIYIHFLIHGVHHKAPFDLNRLVVPPLTGFATAYALYSMLGPFVSESIKLLFAAGFATAYIAYDLTHFYCHFGAPNENSRLYILKRYHMQHHFAHHERAFGISNKFWDIVGGTEITLRKLTKSIIW